MWESAHIDRPQNGGWLMEVELEQFCCYPSAQSGFLLALSWALFVEFVADYYLISSLWRRSREKQRNKKWDIGTNLSLYFDQTKIGHLMRWAEFHFSSSEDQLQLLFKVIVEYQVWSLLVFYVSIPVGVGSCGRLQPDRSKSTSNAL